MSRKRGGGGRGAPAAASAVVQLSRRGRHWTGEPFFDRGRRVIVERDKRLKEGALALVRTTGTGRGQAKVVRLVGRPDVARDVLEALMLDRGLRRRFDPVVERDARAAAEGDGRPTGSARRRDLRDLATFTIDPASAKDFDDAISAEALGDGHWRVWVHIADVCAYVAPGSLVDREANRRATSVYVPTLVEPMLPEALSNQACSLVPFQDRLAVTVELEVRGAKVSKAAFYRSTVRSDERLDYDRVDRIFAGREAAAEPWAAPLAAARAAAAALGSARGKQAIALDTAEPEFAFDDRGHVTAVRGVPQTESHRLIEHLMIAANEQVAGVLEDRKLPRSSACTSARSRRRSRSSPTSSPRSTSRRRPSRSACRRPRPPRSPASCRARSRRGSRRPATGARRSPRSCCARSSRRGTRRATPATPGWAARATATSPRRSGAIPT
jgi:ribonuclease R